MLTIFFEGNCSFKATHCILKCLLKTYISRNQAKVMTNYHDKWHPDSKSVGMHVMAHKHRTVPSGQVSMTAQHMHEPLNHSSYCSMPSFCICDFCVCIFVCVYFNPHLTNINGARQFCFVKQHGSLSSLLAAAWAYELKRRGCFWMFRDKLKSMF